MSAPHGIMTDMKDRKKGLPLRAVIGRAAQLDAEEPTMSSADIRAIAAELGLSTDAVERAIAEAERAQAGEESRTVDPVASTPRRVSLLVLAAGAVSALALAIAERNGGLDGLVTATAFASMGALALNLWHAGALNGRWRYTKFHLASAFTWSAFALILGPDVINLATPVFAMGAAVGGTAILALRDWHIRRNTGDPIPSRDSLNGGRTALSSTHDADASGDGRHRDAYMSFFAATGLQLRDA